MSAPLFVTSGDMLADRRYDLARAYEADGDLAAAADLLAQAVELAPNFASAWFALSMVREKLGDLDGAVAAFRRAREADTEDRHGAGMHLARLGATDAATAIARAYVRTLFDQYAPRFDRALEDLSYNAPALLCDAVVAAHPGKFATMLDLGCGTGLGGAAFRPYVDWLVGVDLSGKMVEEARRKGLYDRLAVADIMDFLKDEADGAYHLVVAADVFAYMPDLGAVCAAAACVLVKGGVFAFTVETHDGEGAIVGAKLRYAHGADFVRAAVTDAGLTLHQIARVSNRTENRVPVPGLLVVALAAS